MTLSMSLFEEEEQLCPRVIYECGNSTVEGLAGSIAACCVLVIASLLSCCGAVVILVAYCVIKDIRKGAQTIITVLAVADLVYSGSLIIAGINYFIYYKETIQEDCEVYQTICKIQGFITILGSWSTFIWTSTLAFYFFMQFVFHAVTMATKLIPLYNLLAWGIPIAVGIPLLALDKIGLYPGWLVCCTKPVPNGSPGHNALLLLLGGWLPELVSCAFVILLYTIIGIHLCIQRRRMNLSTKLEHVEKRLLLIPIVYIFLRIWNTAEFALLSKPSFNSDPCSQTSTRTFFYIITILQVAADSSQGWVNAVLYVFLSKRMRQRLFWQPLRKLAKKIRRQQPPSRPLSLHGRPTSEATPLMQGTVIGKSDQTARGYDTHYSFPTEFAPTSPTNTNNRLLSPMRTPAQANIDVEFSTVGRNDTRYTPPATDIASVTC